MGAKRNLVLGRVAGVLFLSGALASMPANAMLDGDTGDYLVDALALVSAIVCFLIPWQRLGNRALHVLVAIATLEVVLAVAVHEGHGMVFTWYFVLVAVFAAYAFRRRGEAIAQLAFTCAGMAATAVYGRATEPDAPANALVGIPTICVAAGVVIWLREGLERRERTDPLTGLGNRRALMEALHEACDQRLPRLLVLFDLDGFKRYNDRLGHTAGDALLAQMGGALRHAVAGRGAAFRLGGDELCVLLSDPEAVAACDAALRGDGVGASHGAAWLPTEARSPSAALTLADTRMYEAKRAARQVPFVLSMESGSASPSGAPSASPSRSQ
jgi:GGDEF domain-containing protein